MGCKIYCYRRVDESREADLIISTDGSKRIIRRYIDEEIFQHDRQYLFIGDSLINVAKFDLIWVEEKEQ